MDHHVVHDINIQAARSENTKPVNFEKHRAQHDFLRRHHRGIEPLDVAHLQDAALACRDHDQPVGLIERRGHGLFDQHVQAGIEKAAADLRVISGGHGEADGVHTRDGQRVQIANHLRSEFRGDLRRAIGVGVHHAGEFHAVKFAPDADVVPAELSGADHGHANFFFAHEVFFAAAASAGNA